MWLFNFWLQLTVASRCKLGAIFNLMLKDWLLTSMFCADLLSTAPDFLTVRKSLTFVSVQSKLFHAAKAIFTLPSAREGINLASWLDISGKFFTWIILSKHMGRTPRGEDRKIVYLNASVFDRWKAIKCHFGLGFGLVSHRATMYTKTKTNDHRACGSLVGL